ncbi:hypothetical protein AVEN_77210-1 [Araneus ventricosus]|uniref:Uncharacterized protein n=1 Tax=Araneus ventricosus TaxID=182803 RepID=A0A4Y2QDD0_ARAVE|nr:hypothetical protein AVEN_77210-1 [Araneus ventricosus]
MGYSDIVKSFSNIFRSLIPLFHSSRNCIILLSSFFLRMQPDFCAINIQYNPTSHFALVPNMPSRASGKAVKKACKAQNSTRAGDERKKRRKESFAISIYKSLERSLP